MRILAVSKRQYMGQDLLDHRFGRFREIPMALARRGHEVRGLCLSYERRGDERVEDRDSKSDSVVPWYSVDLGSLVLPGLAEFVRVGRRTVREFQPEIIWAGSDGPYAALASLLAMGNEARVIFDVYDDFDTFASARIPGARTIWHRSCRRAAGVSSFSEAMTARIEHEIGRTGPTLTLVNGTDTVRFSPMDRTGCRERLGLPVEGRLIGLIGSLSGRSGMATVMEAFSSLSRSDQELHLIVAGPRDETTPVPNDPRVHDLGVVDHEVVPLVLNALDLGVVLPREGPAGRLGFPYRAYEMLACGLPVVAASLGAMESVLSSCPAALFDPASVDDAARAIEFQLGAQSLCDVLVPDWDEVSSRLERFARDIASWPGRESP